MMLQLNLFQWIVVPVLLLFFLHSLVLMTRGTNWRNAGVRAILWLVAAATVFQPKITISFARVLGIGRGTDLVLYLFIIASLCTAFYFYGRVVKLESAITVLVRESVLQDAANTKT